IPDRRISLDDAVGHVGGHDTASTIVMQCHLPHCNSGIGRSPDEDSVPTGSLEQSGTEDLHICLVRDNYEVDRRGATSRITGGRIVWIGGTWHRGAAARPLYTGGARAHSG